MLRYVMYKFTLAMRCLLHDVNVMVQLEDLFLNMKNGNNLQHRDLNLFQWIGGRTQETSASQSVMAFMCWSYVRRQHKISIFSPKAQLINKQGKLMCQLYLLHGNHQNRIHFIFIFYTILKVISIYIYCKLLSLVQHIHQVHCSIQ